MVIHGCGLWMCNEDSHKRTVLNARHPVCSTVCKLCVVCNVYQIFLVDLVEDVLNFDVNIHRSKRSRRNEKDKLPSGVEPRSSDQQTSTADTEP